MFETGHILVNDVQLGFFVTRSPRRKRTISFQLDQENKIHVRVPNRTSLTSIHRLLQKRAAWFAHKINERQRLSFARPLSFDKSSAILYLGHACRLHITQNEGAPRQCIAGVKRFTINIPDTSLSTADLRAEVRLELLLWLKKRARIVFEKRADLWAARLGLDYKKMLVVNPAQQWGSCNAQNVIRLNWRLIMAPLPLLDYVVAHELCHVPHKNHGPRFWRLLSTVMPDYKHRRKQLRLMGPALTL